MTPLQAGIASAAALAAGAINSIAGGGTLVTFPTLVWLGLPSVIANATNTVAIWPGSLGGMWGYRRELAKVERRLWLLVVPSLAGGLIGALLLRYTPPEVFDALVPYLILFATLLFMAQEPIQRWLKKGGTGGHRTPGWLAGAMVFQLFVGLYGGYFGAGIGILMLAALSILGLEEIHQMNGLKNVFALAINGVAAVYFIWMKMVNWPFALLMALTAIAGGYWSAGIARRMSKKTVRRVVVALGFVMAFSLLLKRL